MRLNLSQNRDQTGFEQQRAFINLSWSIPKIRQSIQVSSDVNNNGQYKNSLNWSYNPLRTIGRPKMSLGLTQNDRSYNLTGRLSYTGYYFNWDLSNDAVFTVDGDGGISNTSKLSLATALVFADGQFGWSRPINNSFAIVVPKDSVRDQEIVINPSLNGDTARIDRFGFAVVPNLDPYNISNLIIDAPNLPAGMDLGNRNITILPSYRSGTLVKVGTDATVFLRGILLNANGEPVSLQSGEIVSLSDRNWQPVTLFTNRSGRFATAGLKPGRYQIKLFTNPPAEMEFEIPANATGIYDTGTLQFP
jgi:outer membrane usher protein